MKRFLDSNLAGLQRGARVLEVGSLDVNGAPNRTGLDYIGLDMRPGKGVDVVANGHAIPFPAESFDAAVCAETLEHDDSPLATIAEIRRVLKPGGIFLVTVPGIGFPRHDFPSDYWRVTPEGLRVWLKDFTVEHLEEDKAERDVRARARK